MRYFEIISESPEQDGAMASQAQAAASTVLHAIVADPKPEHEVELGKYGDFFLYNPKALGLTKDYPELSDLAVMIGKPQKNAIGNSGAVINYRPLKQAACSSPKSGGNNRLFDASPLVADLPLPARYFVFTFRAAFKSAFNSYPQD